MKFRVRLDTAYFTETKNNKKITIHWPKYTVHVP